MTIRTVQAKSLPQRTGFAYAGTETAPITPTMASAYHRDSVILVVMIHGGTVELRPTERARYSTSPVEDGATYLRWCRMCEDPHLLRVSAGKTAATYCDARSAALRAEKSKTRRAARETTEAAKAAEHAAQIEARYAALMNAPKSRTQLVTIQLRNVARTDGTASKRFAVVANQYGVELAEAKARALSALDAANQIDASQGVVAA